MSICEKTIQETARLLRERKIGAVELTQQYLNRIKKKNPDINAYITICEEEALKAARAAQKLLDAEGETSLLCGIPMGMKDNICTKEIRTTCGSKMLENFVPPYSATVWNKLSDAGAVLLGKLNMDEFAMGSSSEHSIFGAVHNPWNTVYTAGGSSGGSAASIAANLAVFALGSDTGGGIRQPASFCGVVGLKPTYGSVSRYGLTAFASSLDQIGPIAKDVADCALVMNAIAGHDPFDSTSVKKGPENYLEEIDKGVNGLKIGVAREFFDSIQDEDVETVIRDVLKRLEIKQAVLMDISLPSIGYAAEAYSLISSAEASSNMSRYDGIRYGYRSEKARDIAELYRLSRGEGLGREVKRRILLGTYVLSADYHDALYNKALKVRGMVAADFNRTFEKCDIIVAPTSSVAAFKIGEKLNDSLKMILNDGCTVGGSLAGLPALSVPCGVDKNGLPVGIQLMGRAFSEKLLFRAGYAVEQETGRMHINESEEKRHGL